VLRLVFLTSSNSGGIGHLIMATTTGSDTPGRMASGRTTSGKAERADYLMAELGINFPNQRVYRGEVWERMAKFKIGQRVWFTKSMQLCGVVKVLPKQRNKDDQDYIVQRLDSEKELYASEDELLDERDYVGHAVED